MTTLPFLLVGLLAAPLLAQDVIPSPIRPLAEFAQPFATIAGIRELPDGRVLVADSRLGELHVIDFTTGKAEQVSRQGSGPGEFRSAGPLLPLSRDTTAMFDGPNARLLLLNAMGKPITTVPVASNQMLMFAAASAADAAGRIYSSVWIQPTDDRRVTDSAYILAYMVRSNHLDTIVAVRNSPVDMVTQQLGNGNSMTRIMEVPFAEHDDWTITTDGRVAVAVGHDYHVEYYQPGRRRTVAAPTPFVGVKVTDADRDSVRARRKARTRPGQLVVSPEPSVWEKVMPAFPGDALRPAPHGRLVVERSQPLASTVRRYDVFNASGVRQYAVTLPPMTRFMGAGSTFEYAVRVDADGQQFLERFVLR
ncbi:MAG TPA: hypothetical protein VGM77_06220 [Gemmatimonadales bacterium]|jgi:hypothetical protein